MYYTLPLFGYNFRDVTFVPLFWWMIVLFQIPLCRRCSWPWMNTYHGRYNLTCCNFWPWFLLIVMEKYGVSGNCHILSLHDCLFSLGNIVILGIIKFWPTCVSEIMSACTYHLSRRMITSLVPLHKPSNRLRFLCKELLSLSKMSWFEMPLNWRYLRTQLDTTYFPHMCYNLPCTHYLS